MAFAASPPTRTSLVKSSHGHLILPLKPNSTLSICALMSSVTQKTFGSCLGLLHGGTMICGASAWMWVVWRAGRHLIAMTTVRVLYVGVYTVRRANCAHTDHTLSLLFLLVSQILLLTLSHVMFSWLSTSPFPPPFPLTSSLAATTRSSSYACNGIGKRSASGRLTSASGIGKRMMVAPFFVNGLTPALLQSGSPRVSTLTAITTTTLTTLARILTLMTTTLFSVLCVHVLCVSTYFCVCLS